jgi:large subunit ribosomal protein L9
MKVILRSDVAKLGRAGDIKDVKDGFGRNFLLPRKLAMAATPAALKQWERGKETRAKVNAEKNAVLKDLAVKVNGVSLSFSRPAGAEGKLFGSVGKSDILKSLKSCGYTVEKDALVLDATIKQVGEHEVEVRFMPDVSAKIKVTVVARE